MLTTNILFWKNNISSHKKVKIEPEQAKSNNDKVIKQEKYSEEIFRCRCCRGGWWNAVARPVLCCIWKVDHIWHPGADMLIYLSTCVSHGRRHLLLMNTTFQELFHLSLQRTLYFEGSLQIGSPIKICFIRFKMLAGLHDLLYLVSFTRLSWACDRVFHHVLELW